MSPIGRRPTAEERELFAANVEDLVWGLFEQKTVPFFDRSSVSPGVLEEFVRSDEVFEATFQFADTLMKLWRRRYPGKQLMLRSRRPAKSHERVEVPVFSDTAPDASTQETSDMPHSEQKGAPDSARPDSSTPVQAASRSGADPDATRELPAASARPGAVPPAGVTTSKPSAPRVTFTLPNAKVGVAYAESIRGRDAEGRSVRVLEARQPEGLGLRFDPERGELCGTPMLDGDYRIPLRWTDDGKTSYSGECLLIVNPDPRSLWKVVDPPADAPYAKPHVEAGLIQGEGFRIVAASRRGRSHEHAGSFRDDDFAIRHDPDSGWSLVLVADGAGSARFSREGSRLAVSAAGDHLAASLAGEVGARMGAALEGWETDPNGVAQSMGTEFHYLFHKAAHLAVHAIEREARAQGAEARDYATTLLASAIRRQGGETFLATFWMGDGAIAAYGPRGRVRLMGTPDGGEFAGQTRFLDRAAISDQGFAKRIGIGRFADLEAVLLMTDGVSDPRFETDNGLSDPAKWDALWDELRPLLAAPEPDRRMADWLGFFSPGHHDDRTIALLW